MSVNNIFILFFAFNIKQFLGDFVFQNTYMLTKDRDNWDFFLPLVTHSMIHAFLSLMIILVIKPSCWYLFFIDLGCHFLIDRIKAGKNYLGKYNHAEIKGYWIIFGADQLLHHSTHFLIIYLIVKQ